MTSSNHTLDRALQQDVRAWQTFTDQSYTETLRQLEAPDAQGILGERVSARHLLRVLDEHPVVGTRGGNAMLGRHGLNNGDPMSSTVKAIPGRIFSEVVWSTEVLRMFTPVTAEQFNNEAALSRAGSYQLKHTTERFARPQVGGYVANGSLIWAAAALGLPMRALGRDNPNVVIGIREQEHRYVRKLEHLEFGEIRSDHYRPPGLMRLRESLDRLSAGESLDNLNAPLDPGPATSPFHDWLIHQKHRRGMIGMTAGDYSSGVELSAHRPADSPEEFLQILRDMFYADEFYRAAERLVAEWRRQPAR